MSKSTETAYTEFSNDYTPCTCGGWDELWRSRDNSIRLSGRRNHAHGCQSVPA